MTIVHSRAANGTVNTPRPQTAGAVHAAKFSIAIASALAAGTILELGVLPAFAQVVDYKLVPEGDFGEVTCSGGLMTGELGSDDEARTVGTELFEAGTALDAAASPDLPSAFAIKSIEGDRGIGLEFSGEVAGAPDKRLTLILFYHQ
ncbi:MAG: hypothetical protein VYD90_10640 [Pseudomonadota bacterium]|nr:hypothetical protein [Pseudomonadota bacterium]